MLFAAAGGDGGFEAPGIGEFFPAPILFEATVFELNRIQLVRIVATLVLAVLFWLASRNVRLVPTRAQSIAEMALDFVRVKDRKSTRLNSSHVAISYAVFCLKKK